MEAFPEPNERFDAIDKNSDGQLDAEELRQARGAGRRGRRRKISKDGLAATGHPCGAKISQTSHGQLRLGDSNRRWRTALRFVDTPACGANRSMSH